MWKVERFLTGFHAVEYDHFPSSRWEKGGWIRRVDQQSFHTEQEAEKRAYKLNKEILKIDFDK